MESEEEREAGASRGSGRLQKDAAKQFGIGAASQDGERGEAWVSGVAAGGARLGEVPPVAAETY